MTIFKYEIMSWTFFFFFKLRKTNLEISKWFPDSAAGHLSDRKAVIQHQEINQEIPTSKVKCLCWTQPLAVENVNP